MLRTIFTIALFVAGMLAAAQSGAQNAYAPPPRNIDDILALLKQYETGSQSLRRKSRTEALQSPPQAGNNVDLAMFYRNRAMAARQIGLISQEIADWRLAAKYIEGVRQQQGKANPTTIRRSLARAEAEGGNLLTAVQICERIVGERFARGQGSGQQMVAYGQLALAQLELGDVRAAKKTLAGQEQIYSQMGQGKGRRRAGGDGAGGRQKWEGSLEFTRANILAAEGKLAEAEQSIRKAIALVGRSNDDDEDDDEDNVQTANLENTPGAAFRRSYASTLALLLLKEGKSSEAELVARRELRGWLTRTGYSEQSATALVTFARILYAQGRYDEAAKLAAPAVSMYDRLGVVPESIPIANARKILGAALAAEEQWQKAVIVFSERQAGIAEDALLLQRYGAADLDWGLALIKTGQATQALPMLEELWKRTRERLTDASYETAQTRGFLAMALAATGQRTRSLSEFNAALKVLLDQSQTDGRSDYGAAGALRTRRVLEGYLDVLADMTREPRGSLNFDPVAESFRIADAARGSAVQRALAESAARSNISDPALAALAREEQDAQLRLGVLSDLLSRLASAPPEQQLPNVMTEMRKDIAALRAQRGKFKSEVERRFPSYAQLIAPKPATLEQVRKALRPGEALISIYVGAGRTYVWAVRDNATAFALVPWDAATIRSTVAELRKALDVGDVPIERFPKFDTASAHALYSALLQPVENGWKGAASLLIVPHRELGQLPFGVLVTAPTEAAADTTPRYVSYRNIPWLLRSAAITQLPSVNALVTLRSVPAAKPGRRDFAGFGDPYFTRAQYAQATRENGVQVALLEGDTRLRNLKIAKVVMPVAAPDPEDVTTHSLPSAPPVANSSTIADLMRLPDTADEIREIGQAFKADPEKDIFLGVRANEKIVKSMDLSNRKVIAFATHGLVPGDLNGLEQPALALTAPEIANVDGDGLLTMDEILALKLNADWVVLSACNTASGEGAGSEAVSGLGRAFFYAGARAILVSNWPVETVSARMITTDLFRREAAEPTLTRAEALRRTMLDLIDHGAMADAATRLPIYTYAHPMFWAPFSLVGDGGR